MRKPTIAAALAVLCGAARGWPASAQAPAPDWGRVGLIGAELAPQNPEAIEMVRRLERSEAGK